MSPSTPTSNPVQTGPTPKSGKIDRYRLMNYFAQQTAAEQDTHLLECFYDKHYSQQLKENGLDFITGRKGTGKTALAKFIAHTPGVDAEVISLLRDTASVTDIISDKARDKNFTANSVILFLLVKLVRHLLTTSPTARGSDFWEFFLEKNGFTNIDSFAKFRDVRKTSLIMLKPSVQITHPTGWGAKGELFSSKNDIVQEEIQLNTGLDELLDQFLDSVPQGRTFGIFVDDVDTRIDIVSDPDSEMLYRLLEKIADFNRRAREKGKNVFIIACIRTDMWRYLRGSNLNKLKSSSLQITWSELDFFGLLAKRLDPSWQPQTDDENYTNAHKLVDGFLPDKVFSNILTSNQVRHFHSNIYNYLFNISFNRSRDFLQYCWIANKKLPQDKNTISYTHLEAIENEFGAYLRGELDDEFILFAQTNKVDVASLDTFIKDLALKGSLSYRQFKHLVKQSARSFPGISPYELLERLYEYSIVGFDKGSYIQFAYSDPEVDFPPEENIDNADPSICVHFGITRTYKIGLLATIKK